MPFLAAASSVTLSAGADSTLTIQNPGGYARVELPAGRKIWEGGQASAAIDIPGGSCTLTTITGGAFYELTTDARSGTLSASEVAATQALVLDAGNSRRFSGTRTAPISTFNGASSSGVVGIPTSLRIPANSIVYGQSRTTLEFVLRKVGASTGFIATHFGPNNSAVDTNIAPATGNAFTATDPQEFEFRLILSYSAGKVYARLTRYFTAAGFATDGAETTVAFDPAVDNYVNVVLSGMSAGTTVALTSLAFDHFR